MRVRIPRRRALSFLTGALSLLGLQACGGGDSGSAPAPAPAPAPAGPSPPVSTAAPVVSGYPYVGRELAVSTGTWSNAPGTFAYQWKKTDPITGATSMLAGATAARFTPTAAEKNWAIACDVTASNAAGSATASSNATIGLLPAMPVGATMSAQGDSVLAGANANAGGTAPDSAFAWARLFADAMGVALTNQAVSRRRLADLGGDSVRAAIEGGNGIGAGKRDFVLVSAGGTDALSTTSTIAFVRDYRWILNRLAIAGYGRDAILIGAFYPIGDAVLAARGVARATWDAFRAAELQIAIEYGVVWLDFSALSSMPGDVSADGFHPSRQGHRRLADAVIANQPYSPAVPKVPNARPAVANLTARAAGAGTISASCDAYAGATGYVFGTIDMATYVIAAAPASATPSLVLSGLAAGAYRVVAKAQLPGGVETPWQFTGAAIAI